MVVCRVSVILRERGRSREQWTWQMPGEKRAGLGGTAGPRVVIGCERGGRWGRTLPRPWVPRTQSWGVTWTQAEPGCM